MKDYKLVGERLQNILIERKIKVKDFEDSIGVCRGEVSGWIWSEGNMNLSSFLKIVNQLEIEPNALVEVGYGQH